MTKPIDNPRPTVAQIMRDLLAERGLTEVSALDCDMLSECARRAEMKQSTREKVLRNRVIAALTVNAKSSEAIWTYQETPYRLAHMVKVFKPIPQPSYETIGYLYSAAFSEEHLREQKEAITTAAEAQGHQIDFWIEDRGRWRAEFWEMMKKVQSGQVRRVYVSRADRLNRNAAGLERVFAPFEEYKVEVRSAAQGIIDRAFVLNTFAVQEENRKRRGRV